ncbi:MAG TPA: hypothetical protein VGQ29_12010 [Gemmatimonadales bacterium]|nr:hypothetical protein [Gemmatimonadales bacterium]
MIVTVVPPARGPLAGLTTVTVIEEGPLESLPQATSSAKAVREAMPPVDVVIVTLLLLFRIRAVA